MERLTKRWGNNPAVPATFDIDFIFGMSPAAVAEFTEFCNRLADYEDTGMEPDEINGLREFCENHTSTTLNHIYELVQAEQEGRLIILPAPAKEGDQKPECFYNDNAGLWCLGMAPTDGDEPTERCKNCWYCEHGYAAEEG